MIDFHIHEQHSGDARAATVKDYCIAAEAKGIDEIGFTTHLILSGPDTWIGISPELIPEYFKEIEVAQAETQVKLRIGIEVDYFPEEEGHLASLLADHSFDFVLGSLHYVGGHDIVSKSGLEIFLSGRGIQEAINDYYDQWRRAIETGLFDIMAHPDYFRRSLHLVHPKPVSFKDYGDSVHRAIDSLRSYKVGVEVNVSGYRHRIGDCYPTLDFLKAVKAAGVDVVTMGSDSHRVG